MQGAPLYQQHGALEDEFWKFFLSAYPLGALIFAWETSLCGHLIYGILDENGIV